MPPIGRSELKAKSLPRAKSISSASIVRLLSSSMGSSPVKRHRTTRVRLAGALTCAALSAAAVAGLSGSFVVPLEHEAIQYATREVNDPVARLESRLASGEVKLAYEEQ